MLSIRMVTLSTYLLTTVTKKKAFCIWAIKGWPGNRVDISVAVVAGATAIVVVLLLLQYTN